MPVNWSFVICLFVVFSAIKSEVTKIPENVTLSDVNNVNVDVVKLYPPSNLSVSYITATEAIITWVEPLIDNEIDYVEPNGTITLTVQHNTTGPAETPVPQMNTTTLIPTNTTTTPPIRNLTCTDVPCGWEVNVTIDDNITAIARPDDDGADVMFYLVVYQGKGMTLEREVPANDTEIYLQELSPSTSYNVTVWAMYRSGQKLSSARLEFTTDDVEKKSSCKCDRHGTTGQGICDTTRFQWCDCRDGYTGLFCEMCRPGYYRVSHRFPCHKCPCNLDHSSGTCRFSRDKPGWLNARGKVDCDKCYPGYTGNLCHMCSYGYFPDQGNCLRCSCNNNHNPSAPYMCSPATGRCLNCQHNTTGFFCDQCAEGYVGDAVNRKNCTLASELASLHNKSTAVGVIAAVSVIVIIALSALAGLIVYHRSKIPRIKKFWTVDLDYNRPDQVTFTNHSDEDMGVMTPQDLEDLKFYEKQHSKKKAKGYAPLNEV